MQSMQQTPRLPGPKNKKGQIGPWAVSEKPKSSKINTDKKGQIIDKNMVK